MFELTEATICLLVAAQVVSAGFFSKPEPTAAEKINEYLVDLLPGNQKLDENLEAASRWKKELTLNGSADPAVIESLSTLEALHEVLKSPQCDMPMYSVVDGALKKFANKNSPSDPDAGFLRTQHVVLFSAVQIAKTCHRKNKVELEAKKEKLDAEMLARAKDSFFKAQGSGPLTFGRSICLLTKKNAQKTDLPEMLQAILNKSRRSQNHAFEYFRMVNNELGQKVVKSDKVKELVEQYITGPCHYLRNELGEVITKARKDAAYIGAFSPDWMQVTNSPFRYLVPTHCLCNFFDEVGDEKIVKMAISLVPKAENEVY